MSSILSSTGKFTQTVEITDPIGDIFSLSAANTARTSATLVLPVQTVDAAGNVLGMTAANTARTTATLVQPVQIVDASGNVLNLSTAIAPKSTSTLVQATQLVSPQGNVINITPASTPRASSDNVLLVQNLDSTGAVGSGAGVTMTSNYVSPFDGAVAYTTSTTVTCSGFPFTVDDTNCTISYIQIKPSGGQWGNPKVNGVNGVSLTASSNVVTISGAGSPFASGDTYRLGIRYQDKAYTSATNSLNTSENNPLSLQVIEESLVDTTNVAASQQYYPSSLGMAMMGYKDLSLTGKYIDGDATTTTIIVQATNDEDATNADWVSIQGQVQGVSGTVTGTVGGVAGTAVNPGTICTSLVTAAAQTITFAWDFDNLNYRYVRVGLLPGDATNTAIIKMRRKAL